MRRDGAGSLEELDWNKGGGVLPAVVQDADGGAVLMLGYMSPESLRRTRETRRVTFWSRSKQRLWVKGETSGNFLELDSIVADCDRDALLILARPAGPVCHTGTRTCFGEHAPRTAVERIGFLTALERTIAQRIETRPEGSYTAKLAAAGTRRIAQKIGEEGVELALAAAVQSDREVIGEAADLLFHVLVLLQVRGLSLAEVVSELESRHAGRPPPSTSSG